MIPQKTDVLIVGGGQAGLAMSAHLGGLGVDHLILERGRIAERWRSERWDSLVANGPAWHDRFPWLEFHDVAPDAFASKDRVAAYFEEFAAKIAAPIECGVEVAAVRPGGAGYIAETSRGAVEAAHVVAATGPFQRPVIPDLVPETAGLTQLHSSGYKTPEQLPAGGVLVVGAGSSGVQIADELAATGRQVYLSVGPHDRPPRRYRGRDYCWWLGVLGKWDLAAPAPNTEHVTISVSGADGGSTVDFRRLALRGVTLLGRTERYANGALSVADDLQRNIANGDAYYLQLLDECDAYAAANKLDMPEEPEARRFDPEPDCVKNPILELDLAKEGVTSIIWATGYALDFGWLEVDAFDANGRPKHERGVSAASGLYFLGLPWLSRRGSSFIWGVWHDAKFLADHIASRLEHAVRGP